MSLKSQNLISANTYELEIESTAEEFESAIEKAYKKNRNRINVPGFRKGKATRKMIEKLYGETVFYDDAINSMVPTVIAPAVESTDLELVAQPEIDVTSISKETGVVFKVKCITKPEIKLENYKGIEVERVDFTVTDEDVDKALEREQKKNARLITVEDRPAQKGDIANIDYEGFIDGVPFEGGSEKAYDLNLGNGRFIPGFEDQIVGHTPGEEFTINVTFPEDYQMEDVAGKNAEFSIRLNAIQVEELPALDDDFAMDVSEFDTLDEYKADIKKNLEETAVKNTEAANANKILEKLASMVEGEIPEVMFEDEIDKNVVEFKRRLEQQGMDIDMYSAFTGMGEDAIRDQYRERSQTVVKLRLAYEFIAKAENLTCTMEEIDAEYEVIANNNKVSADVIKKIISSDDIKKDILSTKAQKFVVDNAVLTDPAPKSESKEG
ncbi:MAG: trigger factor [Oscillospiraceae bacterium]|nr:trigger factor [Oscillospiraceae bacterium]